MAFPVGWGPWGARAVDQDGHRPTTPTRTAGAAAAAARCSIALLSRRPSVSPLSKSPSPLFTGVLAVLDRRRRRAGPLGEQARTRATETTTALVAACDGVSGPSVERVVWLLLLDLLIRRSGQGVCRRSPPYAARVSCRPPSGWNRSRTRGLLSSLLSPPGIQLRWQLVPDDHSLRFVPLLSGVVGPELRAHVGRLNQDVAAGDDKPMDVEGFGCLLD